MRLLPIIKFVALVSLTCSILPAYAEEVIVETVYYDSINDGFRGATFIDRTTQGRPVATAAIPDPNNEFGRSFTGNAINTAGTGPITRMDLLISATNTPLTAYQSIRINTQFWEQFADNSPNPWFTNAGAFRSNEYNTFSALPSNFAFLGSGVDFSLYRVSIEFASPVNFTDPNLNGVVFNIQGNTGSGFFNTNNLSTYRTRGNGYLVGSSPILPGESDRGGYLRNNRGRTDYNFTNNPAVAGTDLFFAPRNSNEALGMRLYTQVVVTVPEANTVALLALGGLVPIVGLIRRRRK